MMKFVTAVYTNLRKIDKRKRLFASVSGIVCTFLLLTTLPFAKVVYVLPLLLIAVYVGTYISILEDIHNIEWIVLFIAPLYFCISLLLFYYLLPSRLLTRIPFVILVGVAMYALLLSENIFNVGVDRTLPLYRAAYSISNFFTLIILFLVFTVLFSFRLHFVLTSFIGGVVAFPVMFHALWTASPKNVLEERIYKFSVVIALMLSIALLLFGFLPVKTNILSLYAVSIAYVLVGITQEIIQDTAFRERVREYLFVFLGMSLLVLLAGSWG